MAKALSMITNGNKGGIPVQNQGLKLSKTIPLEKIEEHEQFKKQFEMHEDVLHRIIDDMKEHEYDGSQPVHIWHQFDDDGKEHYYLIDGYTRVTAARTVGLKTVPYYEHEFKTYDEALHYVLHLQLDRRNLSESEKLKFLRELMGSEYIQNYEGLKAQAIADELGISTRSAQRAIAVEQNATDEQKARIENNEATINQIYNETVKEKKAAKKKNKSEENEDDDLSDSLSDNRNPQGLNFNHSDGIERPDYSLSSEEDDDRTHERRTAYLAGRNDGFAEGVKYVLLQTLVDTPFSTIFSSIFESGKDLSEFTVSEADSNRIKQAYSEFSEESEDADEMDIGDIEIEN